LYIMRKLRGIRPFGRFRHPPKPWNPPETINKKKIPPPEKNPSSLHKRNEEITQKTLNS
jgi:hypothetical protein